MTKKETVLKRIIYGADGKELSEEQRKAVLSRKKHVRIVAGPGTGKTETLTKRILYLLLYEEIDPKDIVAFTFTESAARSMKNRIHESILKITGNESYLSKLSGMFVGTIHSYSLKILQEHFDYGEYEVMDENEEMAFVMRNGFRLGLKNLMKIDGENKKYNYGEICQKFLETVNVVYNELVDEDELKQRNPEFYEILKRYEELLEKTRRMTFGRIMYLAVRQLEKNPDRIPKVKHFIVDEYQDINRAQERLITLIGKRANVMIVGDPRQTIYQWRGSDDRCFDRFSEEIFRDAETVELTENRRSGKSIVRIGNTVSLGFRGLRIEEMRSARREDGKVYFYRALSPEDEARWIAQQIKYLKSSGLDYSDMAIILRSVNVSGSPIIYELKKNNIPFIVSGKSGLFRRGEAVALGKLFSWLSEDGFWSDKEGKLEGRELLDSAIDDWIHTTHLLKGSQKKLIRKKLEEWKDHVWNGVYRNFQEIFHSLLVILKLKRLNPDNDIHKTVMANVGIFSNLLDHYERAVRLGGNELIWNKTTFKGLMWFIHFYGKRSYEENFSEFVTGVNAVMVTTVHQAKGLEWSVVFTPSLVDGVFPSHHMGEKRTWLISRDMFLAERYDLSEDDERRLFFVAVTRAKGTLVLSTHGKSNVKRKGDSRFLREILAKDSEIVQDITLNKKVRIKFDPRTARKREDSLVSLDVNEIIDYMKCPYFYRMRHIWRFSSPLTEQLGYGRALHYCLKKTVESIKNGRDAERAIKNVIENKFYMPFAPPVMTDRLKESARKVLTDYVMNGMEDIKNITDAEYRYEMSARKFTITGRVDVIIRRNNEVEVRDYKTSERVSSPRLSEIQIALYALGLKHLDFLVRKGSIVYLEEKKMREIKIDERKIRQARKIAEMATRGIKKEKFRGKRSGFCSECDFKRICKFNNGARK